MENNLTDRSFWKSFWESRKGLIFKLKPNYVFGDILAKIIAEKGVQNAIELGGFPGYYSIYLKKYQHLKTTLLDYFIHPNNMLSEDSKDQLNRAQEMGGIEFAAADFTAQAGAQVLGGFAYSPAIRAQTSGFAQRQDVLFAPSSV